MLNAAADAATNQIHGLGRGGNVPDASRPGQRPLPPTQHGEQQGRNQPTDHGNAGIVRPRALAGDGDRRVPTGEDAGPQPSEGRHPGHGRGRGRGAVPPQQRDRLWKDQHKGSVGNHNRKDRAAKKTGML